MGRIGETIRRTWQLAHVMKRVGGGGRRREGDDNARVLRYLAKFTAEPARVHGIDAEVGSLRAGRLADIVLWRPGAFGVKPELMLKAGAFAWGALGQGNATVEGVQPTSATAGLGRARGCAPPRSRRRSSRRGSPGRHPRTARQPEAVRAGVTGTRSATRGSLLHNAAVLPIEVDPGDGTVTLEGRVLVVEPVSEVQLSRRYLLAYKPGW